jgi:flagellar L-ring protein FlgH
MTGLAVPLVVRARVAALLLPLLVLGGCAIGQRLAEVGRPPGLSPIENPVGEPGYRPVSLPMPDPEPLQSAGATSL